MKKMFICILSIVTLSLVTGVFNSSNPVLANPLMEELDGLFVFESDLENADIEAFVAEIIAETDLSDVAGLTALIEEAEEAVFILNQPSHLALFLDGYIVNNGDTVLLGSNINMSGFPTLAGRSYFNGIFDGNGFAISNLSIESNGANIGFINESSQITLRDITFENLQVTGNASSNTGGVIGLLSGFFGSSTIESVSITGNSFVREGVSIGGFNGRLEGTSLHILNSKNHATVEGGWPNSSPLQIGGFVGEAVNANLYIDNSENHGNIAGPNPSMGTGGFIGRAYGNYSGPSIKITIIVIFNSTNYGPVTNTSRAGGGFIGRTNDSAFNRLNILIEDSENHGFITGIGWAGGAIGEVFNYYSQISIINVYNSGRVDGSGAVAGGIIGTIESDQASSANLTLINVQNSGNIISNATAGGIIGRAMRAHIEIQGAINTGDVGGSFGAAGDAGGIIGWVIVSEVEIQNATNSGMVHASRAGGILGAVFGNAYVIVTNWSNTGLIIGTQNAGQGVGFVEPGSTVIM